MNFLLHSNDLCRICTSKLEIHDKIHIFNGEGQTREIYHKICCCLPVTVCENDALPKFICSVCANQLDSYFKFREFSLKSEAYLLNLVGKQSQNAEFSSNTISSERNIVDNIDARSSQFCHIELQTKFTDKCSDTEEDRILNVNCKSTMLVKNDEDTGQMSPSEAEEHRKEVLRRLSALYTPSSKLSSQTGSILKRSKRISAANRADIADSVRNTRSILKSLLEQKAKISSEKDISQSMTSLKSHEDSITKTSSDFIQNKADDVVKVNQQFENELMLTPKKRYSRSLLYNNKNTSQTIQDNISTGVKQPSISMLQCDYCKLLFSSRTLFIDHIKSAHQRVFKCNKCGDKFKTRSKLKVHNKKHIQKMKRERAEKKKKKKCNVCGKEYLHNKDLRLHERSHTGEKPFSCTYCEKCFSSTSARNKHIQVHEKRWSHVCSYCGKGFVDKIHFVYHVQKHHTGERPFPCNQCEKKFVRKHDLLMHEANMHSTEPRQCYKCEICSKTFTNKSYLKTHTRNHVIPIESRKKFKCNICEAVFCSKRNSIQHTLTHTGELPYECDLCKKRFNNKHGLEIHLLIHSGLKKYVCEVCGKAFALQNTLVCHRRTHTGERPYQCDICDQRFTQKSSLNAHRKRHVRE